MKIFPVVALLIFLLFSWSFVLAQYTNQEKIPGAQPTQRFDQYLKDIINFGFATIGILALFMIVIGAYQYLMAAGNIGKVDSAKETIFSAVFGLILGLCAWIILEKINPDLVGMNLSNISGLGSGTMGGNPGAGGILPISNNTPEEIKQKAREYAAKYNVPENIALKMISAESGFRNGLTSSKGAQGLLQLMPGTAGQYGVTNPFDINQNLDAGYHYASDLYNKYNDWGKALAAYNMGPNAFDAYLRGERNMPQETRDYVNKITGGCSFC